VAENYRVAWDSDARADLQEIVRFMAEDRPPAARRVAERLSDGVNSLRHHTQRCRRVPELAALPEFANLAQTLDIRELIIRPWPTYVIEGRRVRIVAVIDSRRDMAAWLERHVHRLSNPNRG
jgi:plasmid stabilization system protein ParE